MHFNAFATKFREGRAATDEVSLERGRMRLKEAIEEVRWVVSELRPTDLEDYGLVDGVRHYVQKVADVRQWQAEYRANLAHHELTPAAETAIFRIVQEALSNVRANHFGLIGMDERAKLIGGEFSLESQLGEGTCISVRIPLVGNLREGL